MDSELSLGETSLCKEQADDDLPKRLYATDRYPNGRFNVYSKPNLLTVVRDALKDYPQWEELLDSPLGVLYKLPVAQCRMSCKLVHALLSRQLITKKKYELWSVWNGLPLKFSLDEFGVVSGLNCGSFPDNYHYDDDPVVHANTINDDPTWKKFICGPKGTTLVDLANELKQSEDMPGWRRLALALIIIVDGVLIGKHQKGKPSYKYVKMLEDIELFKKFPWGRESFIKTIRSMTPKSFHKTKCLDPEASLREQLQQVSMVLQGFPVVLQLIAYREIPLLLRNVPNVELGMDFTNPLFQKLRKLTTIAMNSILKVEIDKEMVLTPLCALSPVGDISDGWGQWDDEVRDHGVIHMLKKIKEGYMFKKEDWPGGYVGLNLVEIVDDEEVVEQLAQKGKTTEVGVVSVAGSVDVLSLASKNMKRIKGKTWSVSRRRNLNGVNMSVWVLEQMQCMRASINIELEAQAAEIKKLKSERRSVSSRLSQRSILKAAMRGRRKKQGRQMEKECNGRRYNDNKTDCYMLGIVGAVPLYENMMVTGSSSLATAEMLMAEACGTRDMLDNNLSIVNVVEHVDSVNPLTEEHYYVTPAKNIFLFEDVMDFDDPPSTCAQVQGPSVIAESILYGNDQFVGKLDVPNLTIASGSKHNDVDLSDKFARDVGVDARHYLNEKLFGVGNLSDVSNMSFPLSGCNLDGGFKTKHLGDNDCLGLEKVVVVEHNKHTVVELSDDSENEYGAVGFETKDEAERKVPAYEALPTLAMVETTIERLVKSHYEEFTSFNHSGVGECSKNGIDVDEMNDGKGLFYPSSSKSEDLLSFSNISLLKRPLMDMLPVVYQLEFDMFKKTLGAFPDKVYKTIGGSQIDSKFLLKLAKPGGRLTPIQMEVLMTLNNIRHGNKIDIEGAVFVSHWFVKFLKDKYSDFNRAIRKNRVKWGNRVQEFVQLPGKEWFDEVQTIYVPMQLVTDHWVGLVINLNMWHVQIYDPLPLRYSQEEMEEFMLPVMILLPHIINRFCQNTYAQSRGVQQMTWNIFNGMYTSKRPGDCGPLAMKFLELHVNDGQHVGMSSLTEMQVDDLRAQYAQDIYREMISPVVGVNKG